MTKNETGGPAFPSYKYDSEYERHFQEGGMTLRDYFAAHAPEPPASWHGGDRKTDDITAWCYEYADAMLEARK